MIGLLFQGVHLNDKKDKFLQILSFMFSPKINKAKFENEMVNRYLNRIH